MSTSIDFTINVDCDNDEPYPVILFVHGSIFEGDGSEHRTKIGTIAASLVQGSRAANDGVDLFIAMDSLDGTHSECYEALFEDCETWSPTVEELYGDEPVETNVLFIRHLELEPTFRGKGIGARAVEATINTFGAGCSLVACKPWPLQYCGESAAPADMEKVRNFWIGCDFRRLPSSDFFTRALWLRKQPAVG